MGLEKQLVIALQFLSTLSINNQFPAWVLRTPRDCGPTNDKIVDEEGLFNEIKLGDFDLRTSFFYTLDNQFPSALWFRIHSGAAHEYMIKKLSSNTFQIWQADAMGFTLAEWLNVDGFADTEKERATLEERGRVYEEHFCNFLKQFAYPATRNLAEDAQSCSSEFIKEQYRISRDRYGSGKILDRAALQEFISMPCAIGGGIAVYDYKQAVHAYFL